MGVNLTALKRQWHQLCSAKYHYAFCERTKPWCGALALLLILSGWVAGLAIAPADFQQGDGFRILYVHVPCAFLSLFIYSVMASCALLYLVWRIQLAGLAIRAGASLGAAFTVLALITGAIWGKPMWGTYWVWDPRLTSELILVFIYLSIIALQHSIADPKHALQAGAVLTLIGFIDIPIIHFSVSWWNSLHQGASLSLIGPAKISGSMLYPLLISLLGFFILSLYLGMLRMQTEILTHYRATRWLKELLLNKRADTITQSARPLSLSKGTP